MRLKAAARHHLFGIDGVIVYPNVLHGGFAPHRLPRVPGHSGHTSSFRDSAEFATRRPTLLIQWNEAGCNERLGNPLRRRWSGSAWPDPVWVQLGEGALENPRGDRPSQGKCARGQPACRRSRSRVCKSRRVERVLTHSHSIVNRRVFFRGKTGGGLIKNRRDTDKYTVAVLSTAEDLCCRTRASHEGSALPAAPAGARHCESVGIASMFRSPMTVLRLQVTVSKPPARCSASYVL